MAETTLNQDAAASPDSLVQHQLQSQLQPGESLLAFTTGKIGTSGGVYSGKDAHIGLTSSRVLVAIQQGGGLDRLVSFARARLKSITYGGGFFSSAQSGLQINLNGESLTIQAKGQWAKLAKEIPRVFKESSASADSVAPVFAGAQALEAIQTQKDLGLNAAARNDLNALLKADPGYENMPQAMELKRSLGDLLFSMQVAAGFWLGYLALMIFLWWLDLAVLSPIGLLVAGVVIYNLWLGRANFRLTAVVIAVLAGIINIVTMFTGEDGGLGIDIVIWLSYTAAMVIALTGTASRTRTLIAAAVYLIGFVGVFAGIFTLAFLGIY
jgi:hypothetical protein